METVKVKCGRCGWEGAVVKGRIKAVYCPKCKNKIMVIRRKKRKKVVQWK